MTTMDVLSLPDGNINDVLSFSFPRREVQRWEWTGILRQTCKSFRKISLDLAPTVVNFDDFIGYQPVVRRIAAVGVGGDKRRAVATCNSHSIDGRVKFLQSIMKHRWMAERITELHINYRSVLTKEKQEQDKEEAIPIYKELFTLLTTPNSLSSLKWLDINLQCDWMEGYNIVNSDFLKAMPAALPSLTNLCLSNCSNDSSSAVSPGDLKGCFESLQMPLQSLSITHVNWMTDDHVAAFLPVIGGTLSCLELIECNLWEYDEDIEIYNEPLTDVSAETIAKECRNLKSLAFVKTELTTAALAKVLHSNPNISTLNLSVEPYSRSKLGQDTVGVIARFAPRLRELRNYYNRNSSWFDDDALIALIEAQKSHSKGLCIYLEVLGLHEECHLTKKGLNHALQNGLKRIELESTHGLIHQLGQLDTGAEFVEPVYFHYVDGSSENDQERYDPRKIIDGTQSTDLLDRTRSFMESQRL